jgi:hypothetical protein
MGETSAPTPAPPAGLHPKGIGGWLLFLCVTLMGLRPLLYIVDLAQLSGVTNLSLVMDRYPGYKISVVLIVVIEVALIGFSFWAGLGLVNRARNAVAVTKYYLYISWAATTAAGLITIAISGLPSVATEAMVPELVKTFIGGAVATAIWVSYLNKSVRVRNTYAT